MVMCGAAVRPVLYVVLWWSWWFFVLTVCVVCGCQMRDDVYATYSRMEDSELGHLQQHFESFKKGMLLRVLCRGGGRTRGQRYNGVGLCVTQYPFYEANPYVKEVLNPYAEGQYKSHKEHLSQIKLSMDYDDRYTKHMINAVSERYKQLHREVCRRLVCCWLCVAEN